MLKSKRMEVKPEDGETFLKGTSLKITKIRYMINRIPENTFFLKLAKRQTFHLFAVTWMGNTKSFGRFNENFCFRFR